MLKKLIRTVNTIFIYALVVLLIILTIPFLPPVWILGARLRRGFINSWAKLTIYSMQCNVKVTGKENLPDNNEKKVLYLANHASLMDIPVLFGWVDWRPAFVAKRSLLWVPVVGQWLYILGCVMLNRKASKKELRKFYRIRDRLEEGQRFFLFPEGTRSRTGEVGQFRAVKKLMDVEGLRVVPVYISGTYDVVKPESFALNPGLISVLVGETHLISQDRDVGGSTTAADALNAIEKWMIEVDNK